MALNFDKAYEQLGKEDANVIRFAEALGTVTNRNQIFAKVLQAFEDQMVDDESSKQVAMFAGKVAMYLGFPKA